MIQNSMIRYFFGNKTRHLKSNLIIVETNFFLKKYLPEIFTKIENICKKWKYYFNIAQYIKQYIKK